MSKNAFYFSHDSNARHDPKILKMRSHYKLEGLGLYWAIIEMMREQEDYLLPIDTDSIEGYALDLNCTPELLNSYINDCITNFNLFQSDDNYLWSDSLIRRMSKFDEKSEKARESAYVRWGKNESHSDGSTDAMQTHSDGINNENSSEHNNILHSENANALPTQSDGNAKRVDKIIRDNSKEDKNNNIPDFIDKDLWGDFLEMRKKKKISTTELAKKLLIKRLTDFKNGKADPNKALENSIMNGWQGVFLPKEDNYGTHLKDNQGIRNSKTDSKKDYKLGKFASKVVKSSGNNE